MKILIVENDQNDLIETVTLIENYKEKTDVKITYKVEFDYSNVLKIVNEYDLLLMDIELNNNVNGIDLACEIRKFNRDIKLVFLSNYNKYLIDGYKAKADLYLLKPATQNEFDKAMNDLLKEYIFHNAGIIDTKISTEKIYFHKILYIERLSRKVYIHMTTGDTFSTYDPLTKWIDMLVDYPFTQPHKSFLINMEHIQTYKKRELVMKNGDVIQITDYFINKFREDYIFYLNRRA